MVPVPWPRSIEPVELTASQLAALSRLLRKAIYWAGPQKGYRYQLRRVNDDFYVRYLPPGVPDGAIDRSFGIVATYPVTGAFKALKWAAHGEPLAGPGGSTYIKGDRPHVPGRVFRVLMAFPSVPYEISIYDPHPAVAVTLASSGRIQPVAG